MTRAGLMLGSLALLFAGCHKQIPAGSLVLTQTPAGAQPTHGETAMDERYPAGSRVVLLVPPYGTQSIRVLSEGLAAAGDPCVSWDGRWVYFAGKQSGQSLWQIYRVEAAGGSPERLTQDPGGAMGPAVAAHNELVYSSPAAGPGAPGGGRQPALFGQLPGKPAVRLTYSPDGAVDATVLRDGRVLYVGAAAHDGSPAHPHLCLYTVNNDGTEPTAYACQDDGADLVRRPRELGDGRIAFLAGQPAGTEPADRPECVRSAAPFATRAPLFAWPVQGFRSVEATASGDLLVCAAQGGSDESAVFRVQPGAQGLGDPWFRDRKWNCIEATPLEPRAEPAGHTTAVMAGASHGTILCLNANDSCDPAQGGNPAPAAALRVSALAGSGELHVLGTVPVAADGSVLVRLPAGVALALDTLDAGGRVLRHQPPALWLQPGENRACVGCHEARNHSPRNARPLAVQVDPIRLDLPARAPTP